MRQNCAHIQEQLAGYVDGSLPSTEAAAVRAHLTDCAECAELLAALQAAEELALPETDESLTRSILAATSGSPCERCRSRLVEHVDGGLDAAERQLMGGHMEHCPTCGALLEVLGWVPPVLVDMREMSPDVDFLTDVMAATVGHAHAAATASGWRGRIESLYERGVRGWSQLTRRPLFPLEAAYVATLLLVLLCGTPLSPLRGVPAKALAVLQGEEQLAGTVPAIENIGNRVANERDGLIHKASGRVSRWRQLLGEDLGARGEGAAKGFDTLAGGAGELGRALGGRENHNAGAGLRGMGLGVKQIWRGLFKQDPSDEDPGAEAPDPSTPGGQGENAREP